MCVSFRSKYYVLWSYISIYCMLRVCACMLVWKGKECLKRWEVWCTMLGLWTVGWDGKKAGNGLAGNGLLTELAWSPIKGLREGVGEGVWEASGIEVGGEEVDQLFATEDIGGHWGGGGGGWWRFYGPFQLTLALFTI